MNYDINSKNILIANNIIIITKNIPGSNPSGNNSNAIKNPVKLHTENVAKTLVPLNDNAKNNMIYTEKNNIIPGKYPVACDVHSVIANIGFVSFKQLVKL